MVRYIRMVAGFTKVELAAGQTKHIEVPVRLSDLARYDTEQPWHDRLGTTVRGAYVVDAGEYTMFVGDCVDGGGITAHPGNSTYPVCSPLNATVVLGKESEEPRGPPRLYGVYL